MRYIIDHDLHMHSQLSDCSSDPLQTPEALLRWGEENNLHTLCLTDHYWDSAVPGASWWYEPQNYAHISKSLPLPQSDKVKFLFGCETDMDKHGVIGLPESRYDDFDFIIVPIGHLHMDGFTHDVPKTASPAERAQFFLWRFEQFVNAPLPMHKVGLAHFTDELMMNWDRKHIDMIKAMPDSDLHRLFAKCAKRGCGIELNMRLSDLTNEEDVPVHLRPYLIAKDEGCKFYLGSDTHHPRDSAQAMQRFHLMVDHLGLTEDDKFHLPT